MSNFIKWCIVYILATALIWLVWLLSIVPVQSEVLGQIGGYSVDFIAPELKAICASEPTGDWTAEPRQFNDKGEVLKGRVNPADVGACQINEKIWGRTAELLGDDLYTYEGNIKFANWLYTKQSNKPWIWSKPMWNR